MRSALYRSLTYLDVLRFTHENKKAQKYLVGGIEQVINLYKEQLVPKVPHILKVRLLAVEGRPEF